MRPDDRPKASDVVVGIVLLVAAGVCLLVALPIAAGRGESAVAVAAFVAVALALLAVGIGLLLPFRVLVRIGPWVGLAVAGLLGLLGVACLVDPVALTASIGARGPTTPTMTMVVGVLLLVVAGVGVALSGRTLLRRSRGD